jgi:hypothetical protein
VLGGAGAGTDEDPIVLDEEEGEEGEEAAGEEGEEAAGEEGEGDEEECKEDFIPVEGTGDAEGEQLQEEVQQGDAQEAERQGSAGEAAAQQEDEAA